MKKMLLVVFFVIKTLLFSQQWTNPVNVSNMLGAESKFDFCIDNQDVIHCVWMHETSYLFYKLYYAQSTNMGSTWTTPNQVSVNDGSSKSNPHIVSDSMNNLYLTYSSGSGGNEAVVYRKYNGIYWSNETVLSNQQTGALNLSLTIDHADRIYSFWQIYENGYKFNYRVITNNIMGPIQSPFFSLQGNYIIFEVETDDSCNLHCIGIVKEVGSLISKASYFFYNNLLDIWISPIILGEFNSPSDGKDIALDIYQNPHLFWREVLNQNPLQDRTQYSYFNGQEWSDAITIANDPWFQTTVIDGSNIVHLVEVEKFFLGSNEIRNLVYYTSINWQGQVITNSQNIATIPVLRIHENVLYLVYFDSSSISESDIYLMKKILPSGIHDDEVQVSDIFYLAQNYPNPCKPFTNISYILFKSGYVQLEIFNIKGQLVRMLINEKLSVGDYRVNWDGLDENGHSVSTGVYFFRLRVANQVKTKSLILIK